MKHTHTTHDSVTPAADMTRRAARPSWRRTVTLVAASLSCLAVAGAAQADSISNFSIGNIAGNARTFTFDYNYNSNHGNNAWLGLEVWDENGRLSWFGFVPVRATQDLFPLLNIQYRATLTAVYGYNNPPALTRSRTVRILMYTAQEVFFSRTFVCDALWWVPTAYPTLWQPEVKVVFSDFALDRDSARYQRARVTIQALNNRLYDATDGQVRLGKVTFYGQETGIDAEGSGTIYFHLDQPDDNHQASTGRPREPGHVHLRLQNTLNAAQTYGGTAAHRFFHAWAGHRDEHQTENGGDASCPANADRQWDTCLMDASDRTELCKSWNHNALTEQGTFRGMDCWSWLKSIMSADLGVDLISLPIYLSGPTDAPNPPIELAILKVEVTTADEAWAGTDDAVYFSIGDREWRLNTPNHDDFEQGHTDTFYLPVPESLQLSDIPRIQIRKGPDGAAGGWKLGGVAVTLNNDLLFTNQRLNRWLEDDHRTWSFDF